MESVQRARVDEHAERVAQTHRLLEEMKRLDMRARLLLAEHRHVVATISDLQRQLESALPVAPVARAPQR